MTNRRTSTAKSEGAARQPRRRAAATSAAAPDQATDDTTPKTGARKRAAKGAAKDAVKKTPAKKSPARTAVRKAAAETAPAKKAPAKKAPAKAKTTRPKRATKPAPGPADATVTEQQTASAADLPVNGEQPVGIEAPMPAAADSAEVAAQPVLPEVSVGTDAAFASVPAVGGSPRTRPLRNMSEVRHYLRTNDAPIYFVGASPFNLLGLDRWVRNFSYINYYDPWDGAHPRVFSPAYKPYQEFQSGEEINNWLLTNPEVRAFIKRNAPRGVRPKIAMVFFDEQTEAICDELGYDLILPSAALREHLDSKMVTTRLGNEAGVPSVPNVMGRADTWEELRKLADDGGLGDELVVQTPYGDSGKTTFFISAEADWRKHAEDIIGQEIKVMRRINNRAIAVEAVLTRCGTIVGPFMSELTGHPSLTPYRGGWCGNEMYPTVLPENRRSEATQLIRRLGDRLSQEGYRGFFEVDILLDTDTDNIYLGELNPRISGASSITNVTAGAYADVPLFLFHLLEYLDVDFDIDVDEINERWEELAAADTWSQMVLKEPVDRVERLTTTPPTGQYYIDERGTMVFNRAALDWHQLQNENEAFFLRIYGPGDYRWKGADLGIVVTKGRLQVDSVTGESMLSIRARHFIESLRAHYTGTPLAVEPPAPAVVSAETPS